MLWQKTPLVGMVIGLAPSRSVLKSITPKTIVGQNGTLTVAGLWIRKPMTSHLKVCGKKNRKVNVTTKEM